MVNVSNGVFLIFLQYNPLSIRAMLDTLMYLHIAYVRRRELVTNKVTLHAICWMKYFGFPL